MKDETTIRIKKTLSKELNLLCINLDTKKPKLIALLPKIPEKVLRSLIKKYD